VAGGVKKTCLFKQQFCTKNTHRYTHKSCEVEEEDWPQRERVGERAEREQEKTNEHECESELVIAHTRTHGRATLTHGVALYAALLGAQPKEEEDEEELKKPKQRQNAKGVREMEGGERRRRGRAACQFVCQECATQSSIVPLPLPYSMVAVIAIVIPLRWKSTEQHSKLSSWPPIGGWWLRGGAAIDRSISSPKSRSHYKGGYTNVCVGINGGI